MIVYFILPIISGVIMALIFKGIEKNNIIKESKMNEKDFIMREPNSMIILTIISAIFINTITILLNIFDDPELHVNIIMIPFGLILIFTPFALIREKIIVKDIQIKFYPILGKIRQTTFNEIKKVEITNYSNGMVKYKVIGQEKKFVFGNTKIGHNLFLDIVKKSDISISVKNK